MSQLAGRLREERGIALMWVAMTLPIMLIVLAMVTDFGLVRIEKNRQQNMVDAAALAGVVELPDKAVAKEKAAAWAFNNLRISVYASVGCGDGYDPGSSRCYEGGGQRVVVTNPYNGDVIGTHAAADLLHVETCTTVGATFSQVLGVNAFNVCTDATAVKEIAGVSAGSCGFCLIGEGDITGLEATGSTAIAVLNGTIHANSSSAGSAIKSSSSGPDGGDGSVYMSCSSLDTSVTPPTCTPTSDPNGISMVGGHGMDSGETNPDPPVSGAAVIPDPLAGVPYPTHVTSPIHGQAKWGDTSRLCPATGDCWLNPGVYESIEGGSGTVRLNPGIYIITSKLKLGNTPDPALAYTEPGTSKPVSLWGKNVLIFLACGSWPTPCADGGENGAEIVMSSGSGMFLTAATSGSWQGITIMADRNNEKPQRMTGSGFMSISGAMYFARAPLLLTGSTSIGSSFSMIIAHTAKLTGSSLIILNYDPNVLPSFLAGGTQPGGLVE